MLIKCSRQRKEGEKKGREGEMKGGKEGGFGGDMVAVMMGVPGDMDGKVFSTVKPILRAK